MPKKTAFTRLQPKADAIETVVVTEDAPIYNSDVIIQSIYPAHLKYRGKVSQRLYEWPKAGDTLPVSLEDVEELLAKRIGSGSCCGRGNPDGNVVFRILEK